MILNDIRAYQFILSFVRLFQIYVYYIVLICIIDNRNVLRFQIIFFFFLNKTIQFFLHVIQNIILLYIILYKGVLRYLNIN